MTASSKQPRRARLFPQSLGDSIKSTVGQAARRRGFHKTDIIDHWETIIGAELASQCSPVKMSFGREKTGGTLHIKADSSVATLLQHHEPIIIERMASFYGYRIIERIRILH